MARTLPKLGDEVVTEIEMAWAQPQADWGRRRLLVVRLIAQHELTVAEIMKVADVSRQTVFTYRDKVVAGGVAQLLARAALKSTHRVAAGRRGQPARDGRGLANALDVLQQAQPRRLHHVIDVGRAKSVGAGDRPQPAVEAAHERSPGGVIARARRAHERDERGIVLGRLRDGSRSRQTPQAAVI